MAATALDQILAAVALVEQKMEAEAARWDARLVEGLSAVMVEAGKREEKLAARLLADAEEREKRLAMELLSIKAIETELAQRARWEEKQWEDMAGLMRLPREDTKKVKRVVDGITAGMAGIRAMLAAAAPAVVVEPEVKRGAGPAPGPAPTAPPRPRCAAPRGAVALGSTPEPEAMEGVVTTAVAMADYPVEDWSDMEGVEQEGLFASQHVLQLGAPAAPPAPVPEGWKKTKEKGKGKEVVVTVPPSSARTAHQRTRQAGVDRAMAEGAEKWAL